ncbi:MAG: hypothetical protein JWP25_4676 [Bradyrhizobium sp.]|nr:hypothetical protein [Bradyrhizobium sp.]
MSNRFFTPNQQFADNTGLPYAGGSLTFYASGTSTPLATYSDRALSAANTNPVVLDSAGRAGNIFLQNLAYKVVLADVNNATIWTADPVYASDFSTTASFLSGAGSPNGNTAGSQGSPTVPASVYWDTTNNILYVCTTTGTALTAVWTAVNASTAAAVVPQPQGYLTLTSLTPIIPSDVVSATTVYYTPYVGNLVPIYNGSSFVPTVFSELSLTLNSAHVANNLYDVFVFNNSGVPTVVTGPTWSAGTGGSITAGSCARGTGAGGTALTRINGLPTNAVQITGRNGATTYTINANLATYIGTLFMDGTNGQITCHRSPGQLRKWGVWNAYNRAPAYLKVTDGTYNAVGGAGSWRPANNATANSLTVLCGLAEEYQRLDYSVQGSVTGVVANATGGWSNSIGINATNSPIASQGFIQVSAGTSTMYLYGNLVCGTDNPPFLGISVMTALENVVAGSGAPAATGTTMLLQANWRA